MLQDIPGAWALALVLALGPALVRLWQDHVLSRFEDDPTLPERLLARRRQNQAASIVFGLVLGVGWGTTGLRVLPLLIVADVAAAYPFRRRIFGETWSLPAYLWFTCRITVANFAFWIILATTPAFAGAFGTPGWLVPLAIAVLLLAWSERFAEVTRFLLQVRPISDPAMLERFEALARRSTAPMPRFDCMDLKGGVLVNAFALPSLRRASAIFTDTLLARLEPEETVAICAHEIAHLEHYDARRLRRFRRVNRALIAVAGTITPVASAVSFGGREMLWILWPLAVLCALIWRAKDRQKNETISDQRAVALTGDAEALARGLIKLYAWGRVPRRVGLDHEQRATHPSLARRIRDIRSAAGVPPPQPASVETFTSADGAARVAFEPARLRWMDGDASEHAIAYAGLAELRVDAKGTATPRLVVIDRGGHKWNMPLAAGDVGRVQVALDAVDGLLVHQARPFRVSPALTRVLGWLLVAIAVSIGQVAAAATALLAMLRPGTPLLAAAGTACVASAFLTLRDGAALYWPLALTLGVAGAGVWILAYVKRNEERAHGPGRPVLILAVLAAISLVLVVSGGLTAVRLHQSARSLPSASVLLLALATALMPERRRALRLAAVGAVAVAAVLVGIASIAFLDRAGRDPLLVDARDVRIVTLDGAPVAEYEVPAVTADVILSPGGASYMVSRYLPEADEPVVADAWRYQFGRVAGPTHPLVADAAAFVDDDRLLSVRFHEGTVDLREIAVDDATVEWQQRVDGISSGRLTVGPDGRWRVLGRAPDLTFVMAQGRVGQASADLHRWRYVRGRTVWSDSIEAVGDAAVTMEKRFETGLLTGTRLDMLVPLLLGVRADASFWRLDASGATPAGDTQLDATCADATIEGTLVCAAYDGVRTRVVGVDARTRRFVPFAAVRGRLAMRGEGTGRGWLTGWNEGGAIAIRLATSDAFTVPRLRGSYVRSLYPTDTRIAALTGGVPGTRVRVYALP